MSPDKSRVLLPGEKLVQQNIRLHPIVHSALGKFAQAKEVSTPRYCEDVLTDRVRQDLRTKGRQALVNEARADFDAAVANIDHLFTMLGVEGQ